MTAQTTSLTVVVPAYDEAACIADSLREIAAHLETLRSVYPTCELIVVDDGSSDDTLERARRAASELSIPTRVLAYGANRGKGFALKVGFEAARGERILFTDADLSTPIDTAQDLLRQLDAGADLAIGSRKREGARVEVHQPWWREAMGKVFTRLVRIIVAEVSDATCGFKAFRGDAGRALFASLRVYDWSFDAELLYLATRRGLRIEEVPVVWRDQPGTKVRIVRDATASLVGLIRIRLNSLLGRYASAAPAVAVDLPVESWSNDA
jgi:dolichyl-phosphate beta-glucosyltransferase